MVRSAFSLPPCAFSSTTRRKPCRSTDRTTPSTTAAEGRKVQRDGAAEAHVMLGQAGPQHRQHQRRLAARRPSSCAVRTATVSPSRELTSTGRCGPCCSSDATGRMTIASCSRQLPQLVGAQLSPFHLRLGHRAFSLDRRMSARIGRGWKRGGPENEPVSAVAAACRSRTAGARRADRRRKIRLDVPVAGADHAGHRGRRDRRPGAGPGARGLPAGGLGRDAHRRHALHRRRHGDDRRPRHRGGGGGHRPRARRHRARPPRHRRGQAHRHGERRGRRAGRAGCWPARRRAPGWCTRWPTATSRR